MNCPSTHGGSGYAVGSRWDGENIICGICGEKITNPYPTGYEWVRDDGWRGWLFGRGHMEPKWPDFILGSKK